MAGLTAAVATLLIAVAIVATGFAIQYRLVASKDERLRNEAQSRAEAETKAKEELEASLYFQSHHPGPPGVVGGQPRTGPELLDECPEGLRRWEWHYLKRLCRLDPVILRDKAEVNSVAFSPDGERLASAGGDGTIKVWNSRTGEVVQTLNDEPRLCLFRGVPPRRQAPGRRGRGRKVKVWDLTTAKGSSNAPVRRAMTSGRRTAWRSAPTAGASRWGVTGR